MRRRQAKKNAGKAGVAKPVSTETTAKPKSISHKKKGGGYARPKKHHQPIGFGHFAATKSLGAQSKTRGCDGRREHHRGNNGRAGRQLFELASN